MAMQPCRPALVRSWPSIRLAGLRAGYATDTATSPTPESFKISESQPHEHRPRWSQTPPNMKAPIQMDVARNPENKIWAVNNNPKVLDEMYNRLLGPGGSHLLPEELKWQAVTHKSFDQGRRGFNDRLALMGRMTLIMETTKSIISKERMEGTSVQDDFSAQREPFVHEQLQQLDNLTVQSPRDVAGKDKLYALAAEVGMLNVLRWKPRLPNKLNASGVETVMNGAILAIIGAITLQHGSAMASQVVRERILNRV